MSAPVPGDRWSIWFRPDHATRYTLVMDGLPSRAEAVTQAEHHHTAADVAGGFAFLNLPGVAALAPPGDRAPDLVVGSTRPHRPAARVDTAGWAVWFRPPDAREYFFVAGDFPDREAAREGAVRHNATVRRDQPDGGRGGYVIQPPPVNGVAHCPPPGQTPDTFV